MASARMLGLAASVARGAVFAPHRARGVVWRALSVKVDTASIKQLREQTGAPIVDCKKALEAAEVAGDLSKAADWLRKRGMASAAKKSGRRAAQGLVSVAIDASESRGVIVEVRSNRSFA